MGRFDPKYSDEQREAIAVAINARGMTAPEAVRAAEEGLDGIDPFTMPESTARDVASTARRGIEPTADHGAQLRSFQDRGLTLIEKELTRIEQSLDSGGTLSNPDITHLTKLARFGRALRDLHTPPRAPQHPGDDEPSREDDLMASLQGALKERQDGGNGNGNGKRARRPPTESGCGHRATEP